MEAKSGIPQSRSTPINANPTGVSSSSSQSPIPPSNVPLPSSLSSAFISTPNRGSSISSSSAGQSGGASTTSTALRTLPSSTGLSHKDSFGHYDTKLVSAGQKSSMNASQSTPLRRAELDGTEEGVDNGTLDDTVDVDDDDGETEITTHDESIDALSNIHQSQEDRGLNGNKQVKIKNSNVSSLSNPPTPTARNASLSTPGNSAGLTAAVPYPGNSYFEQGQISPSGHVGIARSPFTHPHVLAPAPSPDGALYGIQSRNALVAQEAEVEGTSSPGSGEQLLGRKMSIKADLQSDPKDDASREKLRRPSRQLQESKTNGQQKGGTVSYSANAINGGSNNNSPSLKHSAVRSSRSLAMRVQPQLPNAENVKPAPPPAMYWSKVPVHGSVPRRSFRAHSGCLADEILWLFGGCDSKGCFRDLWCFDTETMCWSKPKVTGDLPPARRAHSATMVDKRLFVFAGGDGPYYFNDLYVFDTVSLRWTKPDVFGQPPSPRRAHTSNYYNGQLIIFGGGNGVGALNDVYSLDLTDFNRLEWRKIECRGKIPIGRGYHTSNLVDGKLIVIGGSDGHMSFNDIHILKLDTKVWYQVKTDESHNRLGHTATQVGSYLFIVGGHNSHNYTPDILTLNLVNLQWEPRNVCGKKPPGRGYHQAWLRDSRLFVHGGFDGKEIFDDLYYIDLSACAYLPQITSFSVELDDE